jgi:hypothetical protein
MARNIAQRLDRLERLASALLASDTSPVYLKADEPIPEGLDPARVIFIKRVLIDPPEREQEELPEMAVEPEVERKPIRNFSDSLPLREVQKTLAQSAKLLIENKIQEFGVGSQFRVLYDRIETPGGGLIIFQGMVDATAESIKSLEGYHIAWVEEAQTLSHRSLALLRPTIRTEGSEIWFSWNPTNDNAKPI